MTLSIRIFHLGEWQDLSPAIIDPVDIFNVVTDGVGRFSFNLRTVGTDILNLVFPNELIEIKEGSTIVLMGKTEKAEPLAVDEEYVQQQSFLVSGRDYGKYLFDRLCYKDQDAYTTKDVDELIEEVLELSGLDLEGFTVTTHVGGGYVIPITSYREEGDEYVIEVIRKICEKTFCDFYIDKDKVIHVIYPIGALSNGILLKNVAGALDNNVVGKIETVKFDTYEVRNRVKITGMGVNDSYTDDVPEDYGFTPGAGNTLEADTVNKIVGSLCFKVNANADLHKCSLIFKIADAVNVPLHQGDYFNFDFESEEQIKFWLRYKFVAGMQNAYIELVDTNDHVIRWNGILYANYIFSGTWYGPTDVWKDCACKIGKYVEIQPYTSSYGWFDTWRHMTAGDSFNWHVKEMRFVVELPIYNLEYMMIDALQLPITMYAEYEDGPSIGSFELKEYPETKRNIYTQRELNEYAVLMLEKLKGPLATVKVRCKGSAGIISNQYKWNVGTKLVLNSPDDGYDNANLVIAETHLQWLDDPEDGNNFICEVTLVPESQKIRGWRQNKVEDETLSLIRELWDRQRLMEHAVSGMSAQLASTGQKAIVNWGDVPYINVVGNAYFNSLNQTQFEWEAFNYSDLIDHFHRVVEEEWSPIPFEDQAVDKGHLRFSDKDTGHYVNLIPVLMTEPEEAPILVCDQHLGVKKDMILTGMLVALESCINMVGKGAGWLPNGFDNDPVILIGGFSGSKNTLEIRKHTGTWGWGNVKLGNLYVYGNVLSDLIPDGSFDLGSGVNAWHNVYSAYGSIGQLTVPACLYIDTIYGLTNVDLTIQPYGTKKVKIVGPLEVTGEWSQTGQYLTVNHVSGGYKIYNDIIMYRDDGNLRLQTPVGKGVIVEQALGVGAGLSVTGDLGTTGQVTVGGRLYIQERLYANTYLLRLEAADAANSYIQMFRTGTYTGVCWFEVHKGDGTNTPTLRFYANAGQLRLSEIGSNAGILLGGDVLIYRDTQNLLRTPDDVKVDGTFYCLNDIYLSTDTHFHRVSNRVVMVQDSGGSAGVLDAGGIFVDWFNALSGGPITFLPPVVAQLQNTVQYTEHRIGELLQTNNENLVIGFDRTANRGYISIYGCAPHNCVSIGNASDSYFFYAKNLWTDVSKTVTATYQLYEDGSGSIGRSSSSRRYKRYVKPLKNTEWIYKLNPVAFRWKTDRKAGRFLGLIAEEVNKVYPGIVWKDEKGNPDGIHYDWLPVAIIAELKKLRARVAYLESLHND